MSCWLMGPGGGIVGYHGGDIPGGFDVRAERASIRAG
jgi:hypothetical protein